MTRENSQVPAPVNVGMFTYSTAPRGSVVHAAALSEALTRAGCDVTLYALSKGGDGFYRDVHCALELVPAEPAPDGGQTLVRQRIDELSSFIKRRKVRHDVFHAQDCLTASALLACGALTSGRVMRTVHHIEHFACPYLRECQARSIRDADGLCAVSQSTAFAVWSAFERHASVVGNGVTPNRLNAMSWQEIGIARSRLLGERKGPLLLSVGGVEPRKNSIRTLEAFALVKRTHPEAIWAIVGGATALDHRDYVAAFEAALCQQEWHRDVVRTGVVAESQMGAMFGAADLLLNASLQEGFGLTVLEALATGLPVVVSNGDPFDEYLSADSAVLVSPASTASMARGVLEALGSTCRQFAGRAVAVGHGCGAVASRTQAAYLQRTRSALQHRPFHVEVGHA